MGWFLPKMTTADIWSVDDSISWRKRGRRRFFLFFFNGNQRQRHSSSSPGRLFRRERKSSWIFFFLQQFRHWLSITIDDRSRPHFRFAARFFLLLLLLLLLLVTIVLCWWEKWRWGNGSHFVFWLWNFFLLILFHPRGKPVVRAASRFTFGASRGRPEGNYPVECSDWPLPFPRREFRLASDGRRHQSPTDRRKRRERHRMKKKQNKTKNKTKQKRLPIAGGDWAPPDFASGSSLGGFLFLRLEIRWVVSACDLISTLHLTRCRPRKGLPLSRPPANNCDIDSQWS